MWLFVDEYLLKVLNQNGILKVSIINEFDVINFYKAACQLICFTLINNHYINIYYTFYDKENHTQMILVAIH